MLAPLFRPTTRRSQQNYVSSKSENRELILQFARIRASGARVCLPSCLMKAEFGGQVILIPNFPYIYPLLFKFMFKSAIELQHTLGRHTTTTEFCNLWRNKLKNLFLTFRRYINNAIFPAVTRNPKRSAVRPTNLGSHPLASTLQPISDHNTSQSLQTLLQSRSSHSASLFEHSDHAYPGRSRGNK